MTFIWIKYLVINQVQWWNVVPGLFKSLSYITANWGERRYSGVNSNIVRFTENFYSGVNQILLSSWNLVLPSPTPAADTLNLKFPIPIEKVKGLKVILEVKGSLRGPTSSWRPSWLRLLGTQVVWAMLVLNQIKSVMTIINIRKVLVLVNIYFIEQGYPQSPPHHPSRPQSIGSNWPLISLI